MILITCAYPDRLNRNDFYFLQIHIETNRYTHKYQNSKYDDHNASYADTCMQARRYMYIRTFTRKLEHIRRATVPMSSHS